MKKSSSGCSVSARWGRIAIDRAVQFISQCIKASYGFDYPKRNGVLLEKELGILKMPVLISGYEML